jgi:hypothetical protein
MAMNCSIPGRTTLRSFRPMRIGIAIDGASAVRPNFSREFYIAIRLACRWVKGNLRIFHTLTLFLRQVTLRA